MTHPYVERLLELDFGVQGNGQQHRVVAIERQTRLRHRGNVVLLERRHPQPRNYLSLLLPRQEGVVLNPAQPVVPELGICIKVGNKKRSSSWTTYRDNIEPLDAKQVWQKEANVARTFDSHPQRPDRQPVALVGVNLRVGQRVHVGIEEVDVRVEHSKAVAPVVGYLQVIHYVTAVVDLHS